MQAVFVQFWTNKSGEPDGVSVHLAPYEAQHYAEKNTWGFPAGKVQEAQCTDDHIAELLQKNSAVRLPKYEWLKFRSRFLQEM